VSLYLVLEGPDGCGKSLQSKLLRAAIEESGREVLHIREPGSTPVGEAIRNLLLDPATGRIAPVTEALLFSAARAELVRREIEPALARGTVVISERSYLSTLAYQCLAYQGEANAITVDLVRELTAAAHGETVPDRIFVLDVDHAVSLERRSNSCDDRIEARGSDYHERVRGAYLSLAEDDPRIDVVDASQRVEIVHQELMSRVSALSRGGE
jgi:dTMP kinase